MNMKEHLFGEETLRRKLYAGGYRMTPQRKTILQIFLDSKGTTHFSADDVLDILRKNDSSIGIATVYRNLELLCKLEILTKMEFGDGCNRYELNTGNPKVHHHHHLICLKCKKITEFKGDFLEHLETEIAKKSGFKVINHELKIFGYCKDCQNQM